MDINLGEVLRKYRENELDFKQREMAELLEISRSHYANLEAGQTPSYKLFNRIVDLIGAEKIFASNVIKNNKTA